MAPSLITNASQDRKSGYWLNLASAALLMFCVLFLGWQAAAGMMCGQIGSDYCQYLNAGTVANTRGYRAIYEQPLAQQVQWMTLPSAADAPTVPVFQWLYPPVFVLPFQLLALLDPALGYWLWTAANVALLALYSRSFLRRMSLPRASGRLTLLLFISLPVFMDLWLGQISLALMVCIGEFIVATRQRRFFRAGLWLGGLLLKPQLLVLVGVMLLVQRAWRILAGAAASSAMIVLLSGVLVDPAGLGEILRDWLVAASGQANVWVQGMMNWRMLGTHLSAWIGPGAGWALAGAGMLATCAVMLLAWRRRVDTQTPAFPVATAGILAGCSTLAWHSHIHMAVMLVPALLWLHQSRLLPARVLTYWVFVPTLVFAMMVFVPETLMAFGLISASAEPVIYFMLGAAELSANLYLFAWAAHASLGLKAPVAAE